tara:strand:- start:57 stop:173 length:117 start_codon:yes stop_codon:yes gene_type:complete
MGTFLETQDWGSLFMIGCLIFYAVALVTLFYIAIKDED